MTLLWGVQRFWALVYRVGAALTRLALRHSPLPPVPAPSTSTTPAFTTPHCASDRFQWSWGEIMTRHTVSKPYSVVN